jgi:hypothetical protein
MLASVMDPQNGDNPPAEEEYKKVILMLRTELGKARTEVQQLRRGGGGVEMDTQIEQLRSLHKDETIAANKVILQQEQV